MCSIVYLGYDFVHRISDVIFFYNRYFLPYGRTDLTIKPSL
jgi:hypothetical protein